MLRLMFVCQCKSLHTSGRIDAMQQDIWRRCSQKKIGGFLLRHNRSLIGLFEGPEKTVVSQVEHLIRKHKVESIDVLQEHAVAEQRWMSWQTRFTTLSDVPDASASNLLGLAQIVMDALQADQRNN